MSRLVNAIISNVPRQKRKALKQLAPLIDARRNESKMGDEGVQKPVSLPFVCSLIVTKPSLKVDMLTWLMDTAKDEQTTNEALTNRLLAINFGAIHTSSLVCSFSMS